MTALPHFEHHQPKTLNEALELMAQHSSSVRILAGGTELIPKMRAKLITADHLVSINRIEALNGIEETDGALIIGAGARISDVAVHPIVRERFSALAQACEGMANTQIRNMATVAGNLANGSPCADTSSPLLVYEATVVLRSKNGEREAPLCHFFKGPKSVDLTPDELLEKIVIPLPSAKTGAGYLRLSARSRVDIAAIGVAGLLTLEADGTIKKGRLAINAVAPTPLRCFDAEKLLAGKKPTTELFAEAAAACGEASMPIDDVRATAAYRKEMVPVLARRALAAAMKNAGGEA